MGEFVTFQSGENTFDVARRVYGDECYAVEIVDYIAALIRTGDFVAGKSVWLPSKQEIVDRYRRSMDLAAGTWRLVDA